MPLQHDVETLTRDNLFAAVQLMPVVGGTITVASGEGALKRGALLTGEGKLCGKTAAGEEGNPPASTDEVYCVLAEDVDATSAAVEAAVYYTGEFTEDALTFDTANSASIDDFRVSARKVGIFLRKNI